jgi:hypothetical protein
MSGTNRDDLAGNSPRGATYTLLLLLLLLLLVLLLFLLLLLLLLSEVQVALLQFLSRAECLRSRKF